MMHAASLFVPPRAPASRAPRRAFTLMELLVVVAMISLFVAIGFPTINAMTSGTSEASAENAVQMSVKAARAYARQPQAFTTRQYRGAAALFTADSQIRLVRSVERDPKDPTKLAKNGSGGDLLHRYSPYADVLDRDPIDVPEDVLVFGISRHVIDGLVLYPPPFAIRFDPRGQLVVRASVSGDEFRDNVLYDNEDDGNFRFNVTERRPSDYDPDEETGVPFEVIETVAGVIIVSEPEFRAQRDSSDNPLNLEPGGNKPNTHALNDDAAAWILANGKTILINRHSGVVSDR